MDDAASNYRVEIASEPTEDQPSWREFGHLVSIGGAVTLLLTLGDWLKLGR